MDDEENNARLIKVPRRSREINLEIVHAFHDRLSRIQVKLDPDPDADDLRALFSRIRTYRNQVTKILLGLLPRQALLRADLIAIERAIEGGGASAIDTNTGFLGATNEKQRQARLKVYLSDYYDERAILKGELVLIEETVSSAKIVRDELRFAFEEASRALASLEFEYRIERSAP